MTGQGIYIMSNNQLKKCEWV